MLRSTSHEEVHEFSVHSSAWVGQFGQDSLKVSTVALISNTANDATYTDLENRIANWRVRRDVLAAQMKAMLEAAAFNGQTIDDNLAQQSIGEGQALLAEVSSVASGTTNNQQ